MAEYKPYLDELFSDCERLMSQLSEANGYFTNYEFIRRASQRHQGAYVGLLKAVLDHRGDEYLFNIAHENIGAQLRHLAEKAGYSVDKSSGIKEMNIWGDETDCVVYRRPERVR